MRLDNQARRRAIVDLASTTALASVQELTQRFGVTASTIRRDLAHLEQEGRLARTYGGARAILAHPEDDLRQRLGEAHEAKRAIGRWAASQVHPGETILLDAGTTTAAVAHELRDLHHLTVVTPGLTVLNELSSSKDIEVECLGGTLRLRSQAFLGPHAEAALERRSFDRVFLGADSVTADRGICEADIRQTRLKELMTRRGERIYLLVHAAKIGRAPFHAWTPMPRHWTLVTDQNAQPDALEPFRSCGVDIVVVDPQGERVR